MVESASSSPTQLPAGDWSRRRWSCERWSAASTRLVSIIDLLGSLVGRSALSVAWVARDRWAAATSFSSSKCSAARGAASLLRPYVFGFLAVYLAAAAAAWGWRRAAAFTAWAGGLAFAAEWSSTRTGVPVRALPLHRGDRGAGALPLERPLLRPRVLHVPRVRESRPGRAAPRRRGRSRPGPAGRRAPSPGRPGRAPHDVARRRDRSPGGAGRPVVPRPDLLLSGARLVLRGPGRELRRAGWSSGRRSPGAGPSSAPASAARGPPGGARWPGHGRQAVGLYYLVLAFNLAITAAVAEAALFWAGVLLHVPLAVVVVCSLRSREQAGRAAARRARMRSRTEP